LISSARRTRSARKRSAIDARHVAQNPDAWPVSAAAQRSHGFVTTGLPLVVGSVVIMVPQNGGSFRLASAPGTGSTCRHAAWLLSNVAGSTNRS
jgi:hypothetical protein